jgi:hypothetical protein
VTHNSWGVKRILVDASQKVTGIELVCCTSVFDENRRFNPSYDESTKTTMPAEMIIFAIGQAPDLTGLSDAGSLKSARSGILEVNDATLETNVAGVFACGDVVKGPGSIVDAVALGRKAATAIDKCLGGSGNIDETLTQPRKYDPWLGREEGFVSRRRAEMPYLPVEQRPGNFAEVALGFDEKTTQSEANRCLQCDLRLQIRHPVLPPEKWMKFDAENAAKVPECEGVFQLLDDKKEIIYIKGALNLRSELTEQVPVNKEAKFFLYEEAKMFTMRESELLQQFMKKFGRMPKQNVGLEEDLY